MIEAYLHLTHASTHNQYKMKLLDVYSVEKYNEKENFIDYGNRSVHWMYKCFHLWFFTVVHLLNPIMNPICFIVVCRCIVGYNFSHCFHVHTWRVMLSDKYASQNRTKLFNCRLEHCALSTFLTLTMHAISFPGLSSPRCRLAFLVCFHLFL